MTTLPTIVMPNLPAHIMEQYAAVQKDAFGGMQQALAGNFRRISFTNFRQFIINDQGTKIPYPHSTLDFVFLRTAPQRHRVFYYEKYNPNNENKEPDFIWIEGDALPIGLPPHALEKGPDGNNNASSVWRTVVALVHWNEHGQYFVDTEKPYIMDIKGMSIYDKNDDAVNLKFSMNGYTTLLSSINLAPNLLITRMEYDITSTVAKVKFSPVFNSGTRDILMMDVGTHERIFNAMQSQEVINLCRVETKGAQTQSALPQQTQNGSQLYAQAAVPTTPYMNGMGGQVAPSAVGMQQVQGSPLNVQQPQFQTPQVNAELLTAAAGAAEAAAMTVPAQPQQMMSTVHATSQPQAGIVMGAGETMGVSAPAGLTASNATSPAVPATAIGNSLDNVMANLGAFNSGQ